MSIGRSCVRNHPSGRGHVLSEEHRAQEQAVRITVRPPSTKNLPPLPEQISPCLWQACDSFLCARLPCCPAASQPCCVVPVSPAVCPAQAGLSADRAATASATALSTLRCCLQGTKKARVAAGLCFLSCCARNGPHCVPVCRLPVRRLHVFNGLQIAPGKGIVLFLADELEELRDLGSLAQDALL